MIKYNNLLSSIAGELSIQQGCPESSEKWKERILYSALGRMAYASLFDDSGELSDRNSGQGFVSVVHFKRRIQMLLASYLELYPDEFSSFSVSGEALSEEIYDIFQKTGCLYHRAHQVSASTPCAAVEGNVRFERGMPLSRRQSVSGLGGYTNMDEVPELSGILTPTLTEMFGLPSSTLKAQWDALLSGAKWENARDVTEMQYLREKPPFRAGYWVSTPNKSGQVSISRTGQSGNHVFFLYRFSQRAIQISSIPLWFTNDPHFGLSSYRAANCCLAAHQRLPASRYRVGGSIVWLDLQYLFPPAELYWIKLYSWPQFSLGDNFHRVMSLPAFYAMKSVLERVGYSFEET